MPVPGFITSFTDKAQNAINASPLASHLPGGKRPNSPDAASQPSANEAAGGGYKSHTFESIQHQLRAFGQQYSSTTPVQKIITTEKGVAIDFDSVSRDSKAQSKELYTWGQSELDDLKDVTDRLAYLNFVQGSLASSLAVKLDSARAPLKLLRDAETAITPRRNIRLGLQSQIARVEHDSQKGNEKKLVDLKDQLRKAEADDLPQEKEIELLKRKAIREGEQMKWEAIREYGEKLVLLAQAASPVIAALPVLPPAPDSPYLGAGATGAARASLQRALDNYKTGHINLPPQLAGSELNRSDTRSFGESHASELSSMSSDGSDITRAAQPGIPMTPPGQSKGPDTVPEKTFPAPSSPPPAPLSSSPPAKSVSPPINPSNLNNSPATIPQTESPSTAAEVATEDPQQPTIMPTVAETGVPVVASPSGPGPASGSLKNIRAASADAGPRSGGLPGEGVASSYGASKFESAEEEKKRLAAAYSQAYNAPPHESAEEEKEREERDRLSRAPSTTRPQGDEEELPPYQDM
ncbi:hypothetical protein BDZ89DRAFT_979852 [Hymenopellis radicata]|nr:hypothetical protein BDZ89DRAFT_979852 [Hymenopellis radicata]